MPTYDYVCDACDHAFDHFQAMSDKVLKKCPKCKKPKLRRLFGTGGAVVFKGAGFYATDYRSDSYKSAQQADQAPAAPPPATGSTGKTDATPAKTSGTDSGSAGKKAK